MSETIQIKIVDDSPPPPTQSSGATAGSATPTPQDNRVEMSIADAMKQFGAEFVGAAMNATAEARKAGANFPTGGRSGGGKPPTKPPGDTPPWEEANAGKIGPNFPVTVIGPDGKTYSWEAYMAAKKRVEREKIVEDANAAYEAMKPQRAKKIGPDTVNVGGEQMTFEAYTSARQRIDAEKRKQEANDAYERLNPNLKAPGNQPPELPGEKKKRLTKEKAEGMGQAFLDPTGITQSADLIAGGALKMGPVAALGAALPIAAVAAEQVTKSLQGMKQKVDLVGNALATMATNEREAVGQLTDGIVQSMRAPMESLPIVGDMVKAQNDLQDAIIKLPEKLTAAFLTQAQKLTPYSGAIAGASAKADVREIMADLREAQSMGDSYATLIDAQSRLDNTVRELLMPIKRFLVEFLAKRLEFLADAIDIAVKMPKILEEIVDQGTKAIAFAILQDSAERDRSISILLKRIDVIIKQGEKEGQVDLFGQFFDAADKVSFKDKKVFAG